MKTSIIDVPDLLSVLTVDDVEKKIGEVPGVASATVNYAAKSATVRYDETLLEIADIKVLVHQRGQQSAGESKPKDDNASKSDRQSDDKPEHKHAEAPTPTPDAATGPTSPPQPAAPKAAMPTPGAPPADAQRTKPTPGAPPVAAAPGA
jgi:Cu2+-exporting ATPase